MKFEIKSVQYSEFQSEETYCFHASLYLDGKRFCLVSNSGFGAPHHYEPITPKTPSGPLYDRVREINKELDKIKVECFGKMLGKNLDWVVSDLVTDWLIERDIKKILKRICYINPEGKIMELPAKHKPTALPGKASLIIKRWQNSHN